MSEAILKVNGREFTGWKSIEVTRSLDQACGAFNLKVTERFPGRPDLWPIEPDMDCGLILDGNQAITGYVERARRRKSARNSSVTVRGRDRAMDLVDCSAHRPGTESDTGELPSMKLDQLARTLAKPYNVEVVVAPGVDLGPAFEKPGIDPGETPWEAIERHARQRALIVMSDGYGRLLITRAGAAVNPNALIDGKNIKDVDYDHDHSVRFHDYVALGQSESSDGWGAEKASHPKASTSDPDGRAPRKLIVTAEDLADGVTLQDRCIWERDVRRARSMSLTLIVAGFSANGRLWMPNERVPVQVPDYNINTMLLIESVTSIKDMDGTRSRIKVVPPSVYERLPEAPAGGHHSNEGGWQ